MSNESTKHFLVWPGHRELVSYTGGRENSIALQAPGMFKLGLEVLTGTWLDRVMMPLLVVSGQELVFLALRV